MNSVEIEIKLQSQTYIDPLMIEAAFNFWFSDNEHIRTPFPLYMQDKLQLLAVEKFLNWSGQISEKAKKDINDEILAEKLEEIIFELALDMALTEDEKLTIRYPFMVRLDDVIKSKNDAQVEEDSIITDRWFERREDFSFMKVKLKNNVSGKIWETEFELPE